MPAVQQPSAAAVIKVAQSQVGYREGRTNGHWNNNTKYAGQVPGLAWANWQPWCDTFVAWCFLKAGALDLLPGGPTASVAQSIARWKAAGRWSEYPAVAAQVCFGNGAHTGIVVRYDATYIYTIEGNTNTNGSAEGDGVYAKARLRRSSYVTGYGYPAYPEGIASADPKWQTLTPVHPTPTEIGDWLAMATPKQVENAVYNGTIRALRDFMKEDSVINPMGGESAKKNPKWSLASLLGYSAAWQRETKDAAQKNVEGK